MPTEELERELRRALTRAAAEYQDPELARQRLRQRDYRPGSGRRRLAAGLTAVAAAGSVMLGLGLSGALSSAPSAGTGTIRTAAFTLTENANGTATLKLTQDQVFDPSALQRALAKDGIPALVKIGMYCSSSPAPPSPHALGALSVQLPDGTPVGKSTPGHSQPVPADALTVINPAALPAGTELFFGFARDDHTLIGGIVYTGSYTCHSGLPVGSPPAG